MFITEATGLENISNKKFLISMLNGEYNDFTDTKKRIISFFHPETNISKNKNIINLKKLVSFLNKIKQKVIFPYLNAD